MFPSGDKDAAPTALYNVLDSLKRFRANGPKSFRIIVPGLRPKFVEPIHENCDRSGVESLDSTIRNRLDTEVVEMPSNQLSPSLEPPCITKINSDGITEISLRA